MAIDIVVLKTELTTDPNTYGYAPFIQEGNLQGVADLLNKVRNAINLPRPNVLPSEILEAIDVVDFIASPNLLAGSWLESLTQLPSVRVLKDNGADTRVMTNLMTILKNSTASEARVRALASRKGSRGEQLFGFGTILSWQDVSAALNYEPSV